MGCWPVQWPCGWLTSSFHHYNNFLVRTQRAEREVVWCWRGKGTAAILPVLGSAVLELSLRGGESTHWYPEETPRSPPVGRTHRSLDGPVPRRQCLAWALALTGVSLEAQIFPEQWLMSGCNFHSCPGCLVWDRSTEQHRTPRLPLKFCPWGAMFTLSNSVSKPRWLIRESV